MLQRKDFWPLEQVNLWQTQSDFSLGTKANMLRPFTKIGSTGSSNSIESSKGTIVSMISIWMING